MIDIKPSNRIQSLPPYLFVEIDRRKREARERGVDIIDFGVGDPDTPTPPFVIRAIKESLKNPKTHQYPLDLGSPVFREAVAEWYLKRFGVKLDSATEILPLIGSKDGITHVPLSLVNPGDSVLVPDPGYPAYRSGVLLAGGTPVSMPLNEKEGFLPNWNEIEKQDLSKVKMVYLNYPNNPTSAEASVDFFNQTVAFAEKHGIIVLHDNAYSELHGKKNVPPSFLEAVGSKNVGVEFHSLSKTFNMTGWRIGFVAGNAQVIQHLAKVKSNMDSGVFTAIQLAGAEALKKADVFTKKMNTMYAKRRKALLDVIKPLGFKPFSSKATFYVWCHIPKKFNNSMECCQKLLDDTGIVVTPGIGFGESGEGYIRFTLTVSVERIKEAGVRLAKALS